MTGVERRLEQILAASTLDPATKAATARAIEQARLTRQDLSATSRGLHPVGLEDGLTKALQALAAGCPIPVNLTISGPPLSETLNPTVYFLCSEGMANIAKHSGAHSASVEVHVEADVVWVQVIDDGRGGADASAGSGLRGLTDRVEAVGGLLVIDSPPEGGTRLVRRYPSRRPALVRRLPDLLPGLAVHQRLQYDLVLRKTGHHVSEPKTVAAVCPVRREQLLEQRPRARSEPEALVIVDRPRHALAGGCGAAARRLSPQRSNGALRSGGTLSDRAVIAA